MIDLYATGSPNVVKIAIMLEEIGRPYRCHNIDISKSEQLTPAFLELNPLGKVPVIVDHEGAGPDQPIFESGAILIYLAETYGSPLLPAAGPGRWEALKWLMFQMAYAGPMLGQLNHFQLVASETASYAGDRYRDQAAQAYGDVERRLNLAPWLGGDDYSIADIAMYPWSNYLSRHGFDVEDFPRLVAWRSRIAARPAAQRGRAALDEMQRRADPVAFSDEHADRFFGRRHPGPPADFPGFFALGPIG